MRGENKGMHQIWLHSALPVDSCWLLAMWGPKVLFSSEHILKLFSVNLLPTLKLWNIAYKYLEFWLLLQNKMI